MRREQKQAILQDLKKKMVFLVGPRQVGKTYLAKEIMKEYKNPLYLNYDFIKDKIRIKNVDWLENVDLLVLDELHKMPKWKNFLKGVYDTKADTMQILVTGSARLEAFRKAGDSMAGRFFVHHLLPLSLKELQTTGYENNLDRLFERGGFPELFLFDTVEESQKWRMNYIESMIKEDVLDFSEIEKLRAFRQVFDILRTKVGSQISYDNIAQDVGVSPKTVKKYIKILEDLYILYELKPLKEKINRSILKAPKIYFYDTGMVDVDEGAMFENLVANALLKDLLGQRDFKGLDKKLFYIKDKEQREVDFAILDEKKNIENIIEVKLSDDNPSKNLKYFSEKNNLKGVQVVKNLRNSFKINDRLKIIEAEEFLNNLFL